MPNCGTRMPEWRPGRMSWKMNGSQRIGTSRTYSVTGRATSTERETHFIWRDAKW